MSEKGSNITRCVCRCNHKFFYRHTKNNEGMCRECRIANEHASQVTLRSLYMIHEDS